MAADNLGKASLNSLTAPAAVKVSICVSTL